MSIRVLIVDDERYSREELQFLLQQHADIEVVGLAESGESGLRLTMEKQPDVLFLDIEMPKMSGMDLVKVIGQMKKVPLIVFATAFPDFAVQAFRYRVLDYLLKPFDEDQIAETVERIRQSLRPAPVEEAETEAVSSSGKLAIETENEIYFLDPKEILYISREERHTVVWTAEKGYETKTAMKDLEQRLQEFSFFRIHKSFLANLTRVKKLTPWFNGAYQLELEGCKPLLPVSRNYVKALRERLEL